MSEQTSTYSATPQQSTLPVGQLKTDRGLVKVILLSIVTLCIYTLAFFAGVGNDMNIIASRYDGKKTMNHWLLFFIIGPLTCGIGYFVWFHNLSKRIGGELERRGKATSFGAKTFWLWNVLGTLIIVGPFVYIHKLCKAMNELAQDYNTRG